MAKFYVRVVVISMAVTMCVILGMVYIAQPINDINDLRSQIDTGGILDTDQKVSNQTYGTSGRRSRKPLYMLATDDNRTEQIYGWHETRMAKDICSTIDYTNVVLPHMSVIICFHGKENVSNLLHTVHSVVQRTPAELLHEIILIDDASKNADFGNALELYVDAIFGDKVRILRNAKRQGLIRSRLEGITAATGEVVVSMDSHVEVQPGWAQPLLHEISKNPKTLAASYIDWMERKGETWQYRHGGTLWKTYFDWTFIFGWQTMAEAEIRDRKNLIEPIKAPVIIGTIFAIRRDYFFHVGAFDEGMKLWGGENLDLPVRIWLCGGRVINVPCSRVGHMENSGNRDYRLTPEWETNKFINYKRFAEVWAGDYKKYFYMYSPETQRVSTGDLSKRKKLHKKCSKDFSWYLDEIFPELGIPDQGLAWGELQNLAAGTCFDTRNSMFPGQGACEHGGPRQTMYWSKKLKLRFPIHMVNMRDVGSPEAHMLGPYMDEYISKHNTNSGSKYFHVKDGPIVELASGMCLDASIPENLQFIKCDDKSMYQKWKFQYYTKAYTELLRQNSTDDVINESSKRYFKFFHKWKGKNVTIRTPT